MQLPPLHEAVLIQRYKRFLADVRLPDGQQVVAHCPNPGSMRTCAAPGWRIWLSHSTDPRRKLAWTWELAEDDTQQPLLINTARPNAIVGEALRACAVEGLSDYTAVQPEVRYGQEGSRVDFLLTGAGMPQCFVEVKSVTLKVGPGQAAFPDAVTTRGQRHLRELQAQVAAGHRAVLFFLVSRGGMDGMAPADDIDPAYGRALREAAAAGVEVRAHRALIDPDAGTIRVGAAVPVDL